MRFQTPAEKIYTHQTKGMSIAFRGFKLQRRKFTLSLAAKAETAAKFQTPAEKIYTPRKDRSWTFEIVSNSSGENLHAYASQKGLARQKFQTPAE